MESYDDYDDSDDNINSDKNNFSNWIIIILIIALMWAIFDKDEYEGQTAEDWFNEYDACESSLQQANDNIEEAKNYTWSSYDEMGEALDNLETVEY